MRNFFKSTKGICVIAKTKLFQLPAFSMFLIILLFTLLDLEYAKVINSNKQQFYKGIIDAPLVASISPIYFKKYLINQY